MNYKNVGSTDIQVSTLALGTWGMGGGTSWSDSDDDVSIRLIHKARDFGITLIDTAPVYGTGHSEEVVGKALKGRRSDFVLSTKCCMQWHSAEGVKMYSRDGQTVYKNFTPTSLRHDLENSLKRLDTDYIDMYITHRQPDDIQQVAEVYDTLNTFKKEGKIRAIGLSNASPDYLKEYLKYGAIDLVQEKFSILDSGASTEYIPLCEQNNVTFQGFSILERGLLTGKITMDYELQAGEARNTIKWFEPSKRVHVLEMLDQWKPLCITYRCSISNLVLAYTMQTTPNFNALFGVRRMENLEDSVKAANITLGSADIAFMRECAIRTRSACV